MNTLTMLLSASLFALSYPVLANDAQDTSLQETQKKMDGILENVVTDNEKFARKTHQSQFDVYKNAQHPRATIVLCSDSRVQMESFDMTPENDMFVVRNIGNQVATAPGSVEYGVHHLKTPVLFIVGHSGCGAIKAAHGDYAKESADIQKELNTIKVKKAPDLKAAVLLNIDNQVQLSLDKFSGKVKAGQLIIVGGVYDFRDDYKHGDGHFIITNMNGETDAEKIKASPHFKKVKDAEIGIKIQSPSSSFD